jgi:hypothetical protein
MNTFKIQKTDVINYLNKNKEFIALIVISCLAAFIFVFKGIFGMDSIRYLMGFQTIIEKGIEQIPHVFNGEMSFGYYLLLSGLHKLIGDSMSLSSIMNNLNAVFLVILQINLFLFFNSLYSNKKLSLFTSLAILLSPSIWLLGHYGNPGLLSLTFFIGSLVVFDKINRRKPNEPLSGFLWFWFIIQSTISVVLRNDIVLAFGAYFGLLYFRKTLSVPSFLKISGALLVVMLILLSLRYLVLGYLINPTGSTLTYHLATRLEPEYIIRNIIKNCSEWAFSMNILIVILAGLGLIRFGFKSKLVILLFAWILPWSIFLVFRGMDTGRILAPTIPIITLLAVVYIISVFKKRQVLVFSLMLIFSHAITAALYYPLTKIYPFKCEIDGRVIATVPMGSFFVEQNYRQRAISGLEKIAKLISREKDKNIMIIGGDGFMYYEYYLYQNRNVLSKKAIKCNGAALIKYTTTENEFYFLSLDNNWLTPDPIRKTIDYMKGSQIKIHVVPFWKENPIPEGHLFLYDQEIQNLLAREASVMKERKNLIYY